MPQPGQREHRPQPQREWRPPAPEPIAYYPNGRFDTALVDAEAETWAKRLAEVKHTQMRRFYEHVLDLRRRLDLRAGLDPNQRVQVFEELRAEFLMLKARAIYAHKRGEKQFKEDAMKFFINHTAAVRTLKDFEAFCRHFEAVMAFHKAYAKKEE